MTEFRVEWARVARRDLDEIAAFLAQESTRAAIRFLDTLESKAASLETMPYRGRLVPELERFQVPDYRELVVRPHRLIYRIRDETVMVLGVFDGRRNLEDVLLRRLLSL